MQNYKEESKECAIGKKILLEFLDYLSFKVRNDSLTVSEAESLARTFMDNLVLTGTADDFARFYGQSKENVKVVIHRKLIPKPRRAVLYSFNAFRKIIPRRWRDGYIPEKHK